MPSLELKSESSNIMEKHKNLHDISVNLSCNVVTTRSEDIIYFIIALFIYSL